MMLLGLGSAVAVTAALVYLVAHACYKGTLFLVAGTLEHETGTRDAKALGGLRQAMPATALAGALAACSMAGFPFFAGFVGKELVYGALLGEWQISSLLLLAATVAASALLGSAGFIAGISPFAGELTVPEPKHTVPLGLTVPPMMLAAAGLIVGLYPAIVNVPISLAAESVVGRIAPTHLSAWHGFNLVFLLSVLTLGAMAALYYWRVGIQDRTWPRSLGFERLYTGSLRGLDAISAWCLPALQSASLRSYVRVLIMTAAALMVAAFAWQGIPSLPRLTEVRPAEAAVALMTMAGAMSAVRARATITAVLSLGVTGYGVALTFLFFGAPDLAMTQFSVETLTAVIFTMVFYHFRRFRSLSPQWIRLRDVSVAILFGGLVAIVLLFVGATPTPVTLGRFFADNSLILAHGRNIVNVILVDFRAMDTMGEITVLATAALGVRALLQMGRRDVRKP
jgi:multicomponent Na+:H+ antiporter subunit A